MTSELGRFTAVNQSSPPRSPQNHQQNLNGKRNCNTRPFNSVNHAIKGIGEEDGDGEKVVGTFERGHAGIPDNNGHLINNNFNVPNGQNNQPINGGVVTKNVGVHNGGNELIRNTSTTSTTSGVTSLWPEPSDYLNFSIDVPEETSILPRVSSQVTFNLNDPHPDLDNFISGDKDKDEPKNNKNINKINNNINNNNFSNNSNSNSSSIRPSSIKQRRLSRENTASTSSSSETNVTPEEEEPGETIHLLSDRQIDTNTTKTMATKTAEMKKTPNHASSINSALVMHVNKG